MNGEKVNGMFSSMNKDTFREYYSIVIYEISVRQLHKTTLMGQNPFPKLNEDITLT